MRATHAGWGRYLFRRKQVTRITWKARLGLLAGIGVVLWATSGLWTAWVGRSLVCHETLQPGDAILIENFDPDYLLFERTAALQSRGIARRVLVPTRVDPGTGQVNRVAQGIVQVMASVARLNGVEAVPFSEVEPISINAARQIRDVLRRERIRSVIVVSPVFRSRRSALVYDAVLGPAGITVSCVPVAGQVTPANWTDTWHGIQNAAEQWTKLLYYRFWVLPFAGPS